MNVAWLLVPLGVCTVTTLAPVPAGVVTVIAIGVMNSADDGNTLPEEF